MVSRQIRSCLGTVANFMTSDGTGQLPKHRQTAAGTLANYISQLPYDLSDHGDYQLSVLARGPSGWQWPG